MEHPTQQIAEQWGLDVRGLPTDPRGLYLKDSSVWAHVQAEAIKRGDFAGVDWANVVEEVEWMGRKTRFAWRSHCEKVVVQMLKIQHARPSVGGFKARTKKIRKAREKMSSAIWRHPGMTGPVLDDLFANAWRDGRSWAVRALGFYERPPSDLKEHELEALIPDKCPWSLVEIAGNNPRHDPSAGVVCDVILPPAVAQRLNQVIDGKYPECGWDAAYGNGPAVRRDEV